MAAVMQLPTAKKWHINDDTEVVSGRSLAGGNIYCPLYLIFVKTLVEP